MSMAEGRRDDLQGTLPLRNVGSFLRRVRKSWRRSHNLRRAEANLRSLSDAQLKDIGIHRSEIMPIVQNRGRDRTRRQATRDI